VNIDLKQLEGLLRVLEDRDISEFEFEDEKVRVHLKRGKLVAAGPAYAPIHLTHGSEAPPALAGPEVGAAKQAEGNIAYVTSPFVGTGRGKRSASSKP
jgi:acetyl-CoA carboxylase biotin carboxyl carrier protein